MNATSSSVLVLPAAISSAVALRAEAEGPLEACGLLAGLGERVLAHYPITNVARSAVRFEMDPLQQVQAMGEILLARGWELTALYHSHPAGPSGLSQTDVEMATYPDSAYVVASPSPSGGWRLRAFRVDESGVSELEIRVEP